MSTVLRNMGLHTSCQIQGWTISVKTESGKLAELKRCRKFLAQCQERGLGWGLGGALGRGQLQLLGSEVTNRCPSQPPMPGCYSFVGVLISGTAKFLSNSDMQLGSPQEKQAEKIKPFQIGKCFLGWLDGFPTQPTNEQFMSRCAAWHTVDALLKNRKRHGSLYFPTSGINFMSSIFFTQSTDSCTSKQS